MCKYYICSSNGSGSSLLTSFDNSLLRSGVANYNLVKVSSILPAYSHLMDQVILQEGNILFTAYASKSTNIKNEIVSAAIAVGIPMDSNQIGVIMEYSGNCSAEIAKTVVSNMVIEAMNNRGYIIKEILCKASEAKSDGTQFVTAFAALAMWGF